MADPILVSQIISSMGLSGKAAEEKRLELERLTNDELTKILANSAEFKQGDVGSFSALSQTGSKKPQAVWGADLQGYTLGLERQSTPETPKKLSVGREKELRNFAADYLSDAANGAKESFAAYRNGFGYVSPDAVWHGLKNIADWTLKLNDKVNPYNVLTGNKSSGAVTTLNEQDELIEKAMVSAQKLNALKDGRKASFEIEFERQRGKSFDPQKAEKFKNIADTYVEMTAAHDRYELLAGGFSDVRSILKQEKEYEHARKTVKGAAAAQLEPPKVSSNERFGQILMQFCGGNKELFDEYMNGLSKEYKTPEEIKKHLPEIMEKLQTRAEKETNNILKGKSYAAYTKEYENAFKDTFGDEDIEKLTEGWILTQRTGAEYTKMAITLAATVMIGNSAGAGKFAQGIASRYGTQTAGTAMKAMFTLGAPAMNMTMDYASALSSSDGLTEERNSQILQGAVMSLPYTIFGSYVSGPIGDVVKAYCKSAPAFMPNILNKAFAAAPKAASAAGLGVEITADTVFACAMEDTSFTDALAREGSTDTGMRVAGKVMTAFIGGRAHGASKQVMARVEEELKGYKIAELKKPDGTVNYKLTTPEGKAVVTDGEGLMSGIFAAAGGVVEKTSPAEKVAMTEKVQTNSENTMTRVLPSWLSKDNPNYENLRKLSESKWLSLANDKTYNFMMDYANKLGQKDPNRLKRFVESELMNVKKEHIDELVAVQFFSRTNGFYSKNFLNTYQKERTFKDFEHVDKINMKDVPPGDVCTVGNQLYVNDKGKMKPLKISKEKFVELFDENMMYQTYQGKVGDCWLVAGINGLVESPSGRAKIYQMFEEEGNDIIVKVPGFKRSSIIKDMFIPTKVTDKDKRIYAIRFKDGQVRKGKKASGLTGAQGLKMLEQAYALQYMNTSSLFIGKIKSDRVNDYADFTNVDKILDAVDGGRTTYFINDIFNYTLDDNIIKDFNENIVGEYLISTQETAKCEEIIKNMANDDNTLLYANTRDNKDYNSNTDGQRESLIDAENSIYSNHEYTVKGYDPNTETVYYSNPHNNSFILELPLQKFLEMFSHIEYIRI